MIAVVAKRVNVTPAQVVLAWALQRGTALLTTAISIRYIQENFDISALPDDAIEEITQGISTRVRLNSVVDTGIPVHSQGRRTFKAEFPAERRMPRFGVTTFPTDYGFMAVDLARAMEEQSRLDIFHNTHIFQRAGELIPGRRRTPTGHSRAHMTPRGACGGRLRRSPVAHAQENPAPNDIDTVKTPIKASTI